MSPVQHCAGILASRRQAQKIRCLREPRWSDFLESLPKRCLIPEPVERRYNARAKKDLVIKV